MQTPECLCSAGWNVKYYNHFGERFGNIQENCRGTVFTLQ